MEINHADKRTSWFEFLGCTWPILSKYAEKKVEVYRSGTIKANFIA